MIRWEQRWRKGVPGVMQLEWKPYVSLSNDDDEEESRLGLTEMVALQEETSLEEEDVVDDDVNASIVPANRCFPSNAATVVVAECDISSHKNPFSPPPSASITDSRLVSPISLFLSCARCNVNKCISISRSLPLR